MNLKEIYADKKKVLNKAYSAFYKTLKDDIENDEDYSLCEDELNELIVDLMLSNVLGEITTFNKVVDIILKSKNKTPEEEECGKAHCANCDSIQLAKDIEYLGDQKYQCPNCK